jgi:hypothetical protein
MCIIENPPDTITVVMGNLALPYLASRSKGLSWFARTVLLVPTRFLL